MNTQEQETLSHMAQDNRLGTVFCKQVAWKSPQMRHIACAILKEAVKCNGEGVWPDATQLVAVTKALAGDDKNCVGTAWRWLGKCSLLKRTQERRKSTTGASKGREITRWELGVSRAVAESFLKRNDVAFVAPQAELFQ